MATFLDVQKKAKNLTPQKITRDLFLFIKSIEKEIFDLNVKQLENAENANDGDLINKDKSFSGVYSQLSEDLGHEAILPKKAGELYNFGWSGDFLGNFKMDLFSDRVEVYSTGEGSGEKQAFFNGYESLYGLNSESIIKIVETRIKPFFITYLQKKLT